MFDRTMPPCERSARSYCVDLGMNPDEQVIGRDHGMPCRVEMPRWYWYRNAARDTTVSNGDGSYTMPLMEGVHVQPMAGGRLIKPSHLKLV